jgi:drug/metabolite transporter (DMT)-like permease
VTAHAPTASGPRPLVAYILLGLVSLVWGSTWLVIKFGLGDLPPLTAAGIRIFSAGLVMAALAPWLAAREGGGRAPLLVVVVQGLSQFAFNYGLVYYAEGLLPSGLVSVLWSGYPLMIAAGNRWLPGAEPLTGGQWLGCLVALLGVGVLFITDIAGVGREALGVAALVLLAPATVAASTLLIKHRAGGASSVLLNRDSMLLGGLVLLAGALGLERDAPRHWTWVAVGSIAYLTVLGTIFTFGVYVWLLRHLPAYLLSLTSYVVPVLALLLGALLGGESLTIYTFAGTALVLGGMALTLRPRRPAPVRGALGRDNRDRPM